MIRQPWPAKVGDPPCRVGWPEKMNDEDTGRRFRRGRKLSAKSGTLRLRVCGSISTKSNVGAAIAGAVGGGDEGVGLVQTRSPGPRSRARQARCRAAVIADGYRVVGSAATPRRHPLEGGNGRPLGQPVGPQRRDDGVDVAWKCLATVGIIMPGSLRAGFLPRRNWGLLSETYLKPSVTGDACSPRPLLAKSLPSTKRIDG